ncbi:MULTISPECIES: type VI secretion system contractile sheath small subunit [unclassified Methylobacterium]|uniref:type VI secretion system contractile sheath small subunit n=1 Tax=unclassified Methylobacterium TaxID=2615210 RepID=UPI00226A9EF1|nr:MULTISPECIES: type VI secretion system contractile sheath small subunit [unclassified Methylobacterium]
MADSSHKFIKRNRPPRVHITYEDPYDAERKVELPFVMGVLADLSGNASTVDKPEMDKREFTEFDMDNFEKRMASIDPAVRFNVDDRLSGTQQKMSVELHFRKMDDFGPASVARQVPALAKLLEAREQLANLLRYMDGKVAATDQIKALLQDPSLMEALAQRLTPPSSDDPAS